MTFLRKIRGALGTGVTWAAGWGVLGAVHGLILGLVRPWHWIYYNPIVTTAWGYALGGMIAGTGFATLLAWLGRRQKLREISRLRVAISGVMGGAVLPVLVHVTRGLTSSAGWGDVALTACVTAVLGAGSALASLWIARRGGDGPKGAHGDPEPQSLSRPVPDWFASTRERRVDEVRLVTTSP